MRFILNYINNGFEWNESMNVYTIHMKSFELGSIQKSFSLCTKSGHLQIKHYKCLLSLICCKIDIKHFMPCISTKNMSFTVKTG